MTVAPSFVASVQARAFAPIDNATLIFFRIAFGVLMLCDVWRYFLFDWISRYFIEPRFHFKYYGFDWVQAWPGNGMYIHWAVIGIAAVGIALGLFYRFCAVMFFLAFTYSFLIDQATYLNHFYLIALLSFLLIFLPANRALSIDARRRPHIRTQTAPAWTLWLLRMQLAVVYFFGGVAKLSPDWLRGEPMRIWMARSTDFPLIGGLFRDEWFVYTMSYGGLLFDLLIVPALLWRRTRTFAFVVAVLFHLMNAQLFAIGIFPWLGIAATTLFLPSDWPRRVIRRFRSGRHSFQAVEPKPQPSRRPGLVLGLIVVYTAVQLLVPLRHLLYPGRVDWTYEGHRFSWRMKLHDRRAQAFFRVTDDNTRQITHVQPREFLSRAQARKMTARPDMILQFAHYLAETFPRTGPIPLRVEAHVISSLNGRQPQLLIDPTVNLAAEGRTLGNVSWVLPLTKPLPQRPHGGEIIRVPTPEDRVPQE